MVLVDRRVDVALAREVVERAAQLRLVHLSAELLEDLVDLDAAVARGRAEHIQDGLLLGREARLHAVVHGGRCSSISNGPSSSSSKSSRSSLVPLVLLLHAKTLLVVSKLLSLLLLDGRAELLALLLLLSARGVQRAARVVQVHVDGVQEVVRELVEILNWRHGEAREAHALLEGAQLAHGAHVDAVAQARELTLGVLSVLGVQEHLPVERARAVVQLEAHVRRLRVQLAQQCHHLDRRHLALVDVQRVVLARRGAQQLSDRHGQQRLLVSRASSASSASPSSLVGRALAQAAALGRRVHEPAAPEVVAAVRLVAPEAHDASGSMELITYLRRLWLAPK